MNFREIEVISQLVNYKSFSDAAFSLSYSPSAITKYVSNVERELGLKLFVRSKKSGELVLTSEGKVLIGAMRRINNDCQYLFELARQLKDSYENTIRIGSQPRIGNIQEQEIIAEFLYKNPKAKIDTVKVYAKDLMKLLQAGRLDAMFVTVHGETRIEEYFEELLDNSDTEIVFLSTDREMYFGVSEKYLPGRYEAEFKEFRDFTFAFPFPIASDMEDTKAISTFETMAAENGFTLKTMHVGGYDTSVFRLAAMMPVAVTTTNITAQYKGIKFIRIIDWKGSTNLYFIFMKSNRKEMLKNLKRSVREYLDKTGLSQA